MRPAYAIQTTREGSAILVFTSHEARDAFCFRAIFQGGHTKRIASKEAYRIYGGVPSFDRCRNTLIDDACYNFHVLPIGGVA
jgi:hypothetical protein